MPPHLPEPDMIICTLVFSIFAMLYRIRLRAITWGESVFLGVLLGLGYLTKAIMFPLAFVFTGVALILVKCSNQNLYKIVAAFSVFLLLSLPYIVVLSDANGRWMLSDAGWINYAWDVNQVKHWSHWQGEEGVHGTPLHPTRQIHEDPPMYEFAAPFKVTYPPWYNPSYWYEGVKLTVDLKRQFSVLLQNTKRLLVFFASVPGSVASRQAWGNLDDEPGTIGPFLALFCVMVLANPGRVSVFRGIAKHWFVLIPTGAVLGAYALLHFEGRYIAPFVVIIWMVLFRSVAVPYSEDSKRFLTAILTSAALIAIVTVAAETGHTVLRAARNYVNGTSDTPFLQSGYTNWKVAKYLHDAGLRAGDPVGSVGWTYSAYWARMARVRVVAEIPEDEFREESRMAFWSSDTANRTVVMRLFRDVGAKAVVATDIPVGSAPANWQHIGDTDYYVYVFRTSSE